MISAYNQHTTVSHSVREEQRFLPLSPPRRVASFLLKTIICQDWVGTAKTQETVRDGQNTRDRSTLVFVPCRSLRGWEALPSLPGAGRTKSRTVCVLSSPVQSSQSRACLVKFSWSVHRKLRARRRPMSPNDH